MKLLTYEIQKKARLGFLSDDELWIYPISCMGLEYKNMLDLIKECSDSELQLMEHISNGTRREALGAVELVEVKVLAPIPNPDRDVICLGINYMAHAEESARYKGEDFGGERSYAVYFSKRVGRAVADGEGIPSHDDMVDSLDYEVELAVIIRKDAYNISPEQVKEYLFGYTILNDVSARNMQTNHKQWYFGKSLDGFAPMGPYITTVDSVEYPPNLRIQSKVNGELRQDSSTGQMIFNIDHIVSELSRGMTLKAGTIISTGTPAGVGMGFTPPRFLVPGDEVECIVEGIGSIKNIIVK